MSLKKIILGILATTLIVAGLSSGTAQAATLYLDAIRCVENVGTNNDQSFLHFYYKTDRTTGMIAETASYEMADGETCSSLGFTQQDSDIEELSDTALQAALTALGSDAPAGSVVDVGNTTAGEGSGDTPPSGTTTPDADGNVPTNPGDPEVVPVNSKCTSILPPDWCESDGDGVIEILNLILNIMTMGVGILATIGLIIAGIQWLTARDKEDQVVKAKSRIFNIVIGVIVWGIMWLVLSWLLPGGLDLSL